MKRETNAPQRIDPEKQRLVLQLFQRLDQKLIAQLKLKDFIACTQRMPHSDEVCQRCNSAFIRHVATQAEICAHHDLCDRLVAGRAGRDPAVKAMIRKLRSRYRRVDHSLDRWILTAWINRGLWLFTHDDRTLLMRVWLPDCKGFPALTSSDAFRKRCKELGVIGWNDFRSTYRDPPLHYNPNAIPGSQVSVGQRWKDIFLPILL